MPLAALKQTIAVDIDEVLAAFAESFIAYSNQRWQTKLTMDDWTEHWAQMWRIDYEQEKIRAHEIRQSNMFINFRHFSEAKPVLEELKKTYKLVIVTSRHQGIAKQTNDWLEKHFKNIFSEIHFAGIWDDLEKPTLEKLKVTKAEVCRQIGADYLIDDQPKHCLAAAKAGIASLLFGEYPWNKDIRLAPNVTRVKNWQAVENYFDAKS